MAVLAVDIDVATLTLNATQLDALFATPQQIVAAPGAGIVLLPLAFAVRMTRGSDAWDQNRAFQIQWTGDTTQLLQSAAMNWNSASASIDQFANATDVLTYSGANNLDPSNRALELTFVTGDMSGGDTDTVLYCHLLYAKLTGLY